jgi:serine/threonine protein kinase
MKPIDEKATFTRPRFLSNGFHSQVILCNARLSGRPAEKPVTCVLKFFPSHFQLCFEKEVQAYRTLLESDTTLKYPKPYGFAEWSTAKYIKTIGRTIEPLVGADTEENVFVLILQYVEVGDAPPSSLSLELAVAAMDSLNLLHKEKIVHGDISTHNILAVENETTTNITWLDFSCSWTNASAEQIRWEWNKAAEYFAKLVFVK